jgi:drug/metabolite transporter (DMT)-like permease
MRTGILIALLSAVLFGASTPFAKIMLGSVDPWMMAGLLYLGAGTGLGLFIYRGAYCAFLQSKRPSVVPICHGSPPSLLQAVSSVRSS